MTLKQQRALNMLRWQATHPDFFKCPKCKGDGVQVSKKLRHYSQCSQCNGDGWKFKTGARPYLNRTAVSDADRIAKLYSHKH